MLDLPSDLAGLFVFLATPFGQESAALGEQGIHPGATANALGVSFESVDDPLESGLPDSEPVTPGKVGIGKQRAERLDQFINPWLAELRSGSSPYPGHRVVARSVTGDSLTVGGQHRTPVLMHVDLGHHTQHAIGAPSDHVEQLAVGLGQRHRCRGHEHHRQRGVDQFESRGFDERVVWQALGECRDQAADPGKPGTGQRHDVTSTDCRCRQSRDDRGDESVDGSDWVLDRGRFDTSHDLRAGSDRSAVVNGLLRRIDAVTPRHLEGRVVVFVGVHSTPFSQARTRDLPVHDHNRNTPRTRSSVNLRGADAVNVLPVRSAVGQARAAMMASSLHLAGRWGNHSTEFAAVVYNYWVSIRNTTGNAARS